MTTPTNAPKGANAPATPIVWATRQLPGPGDGSVTISTAQLGPFELEVHDTTGGRGQIRIALWTVEKDGKRLGEGVLDSTDDAKIAAVRIAHRLLIEAPPVPRNDDAGSRVIPARFNGLPKRGVRRGAHPDCELLFAWDSFQALATSYQCAPDGETSRYVLMMENIGERIEAFIPKTLEGAAIQLRHLLTRHLNVDCGWNTLVFGDDPDKDFRDIVDNDPHAGAIWNMIQNIDGPAARIARRGQGQPAKGPDHSSAPSA